MTGDFRDPSEEMKRLLRRIEEIDEAQQREPPQAQDLESSEFGERTRLPGSGREAEPALRPHGEQVDADVTTKIRKRRLARRMAIAGLVVAVIAAIPIALIRAGLRDSKSVTQQSTARAPRDAAPEVAAPVSAPPDEVNSEPAKQQRALLPVPPQRTSLQSDEVWRIGVSPMIPGKKGTLVIKGLATGATLPIGRPLDDNSWELDASDADRAFITPPSGFAGTMDLTIELRLADAIIDKQGMQVEWLRKTTSAVPQGSTIRMEPGEITRLLTRGEALLAGGEIAAARAVFKRLADSGEPRAALALAQTYEQSTLDRLGAKGLVAEMEMARTWYERAKELGSVEAQHRLDMLATQNK